MFIGRFRAVVAARNDSGSDTSFFETLTIPPVHPEVEELRSKLKEILYDCVTEVHATKAALFLLDHPANQFELISEYGFKASTRTRVDDADPIVERCSRGPAALRLLGCP